MKSILFFGLAAIPEISGCFSVWVWVRRSQSAWWLLPGVSGLILFAYLLAQAETPFAGRAYAAYGGVYIAASLLWLYAVERTSPDRYDVLGALLCLTGAGIILLAPRSL